MVDRDVPAGAPVSGVLTEDQRALLRAVLDRLVPAEGPFPSAGDLQVDLFIERAVHPSATLRRMVVDGLRAIELESARGGAAFPALPPDRRDGVLLRVEATAPLFFAWLVDLTYRGYYVSPDVHAALGYDGRPPQPRGFPVAPFDEALLSRQMARPPLWRPTPVGPSGRSRD